MKFMSQTGITRQGLSLLLILLLGLFTAPVWADKINTGYFGNVAIKGYDPVAFFTHNRAMKGSEQYSLDWLGAEWHFVSSEHRKLFEAAPVKYAPQYGGHCADGIAYGDRTTNIDPEAWRIIEGKLYLNYDQGAAAELEEVPGQLDKIKENWPKVSAQLVVQ